MAYCITRFHVILLLRYHKGNAVKEGSRIIMSLELDQKLYYMARLDIKNVENSDGGDYKIVASNTHGEATATINLNFEDSAVPK